MNTISSIRFLITKKGYISAVINDTFTVVKNENKYTLYRNIAGGLEIESTSELITEFSKQFSILLENEQKTKEQIQAEKQEAERERIAEMEEMISGLTPNEFADIFKITRVETAWHWSDLYEGRSTFSLLISSNEEFELLEMAIRLNGWGGEFGELKNRAGEHHSTFSAFYDLEDYRKRCDAYLNEQFFYRDQETEEESTLQTINEAETIEAAREALNYYDNLQAGYYCNSGTFICSPVGHNFWGYCYDVYSYSFGFKFNSMAEFYNGHKIEEEEN